MMALYAEWLSAFERSALGHLARHSAWTSTTAYVLHVLGAAFVVGAIAVFDGALVMRRFDDAARISRVAISIAAGGLVIQVPTGLVLLATEATKLGTNPAFYAKMIFIAVGLANVAFFHGRFGKALRFGALDQAARVTAFVSLGAWILTLSAGCMIAYL
jgi:hypothetical protein